MKGTPVYATVFKGGKPTRRIVARVIGNTLYQTIRIKRIVQLPARAIAFEKQMIDDAERLGATYIVVTIKNTGLRYLTSLEAIRSQGVLSSNGQGEMISLELASWKTT